jgi:hypothetical protein
LVPTDFLYSLDEDCREQLPNPIAPHKPLR